MIRDAHKNNLSYGKVGTSSTAFLASQTGLTSAVTASSAALTFAQASQSNQVRYKLSSSTATANTFREFATYSTAGTAYDRIIFPGFAHTGDSDFIIVKTYFYDQKS